MTTAQKRTSVHDECIDLNGPTLPPSSGPTGGCAAPTPPTALRTPEERWQPLGGGLGFQLTCDCLSPTFLVLCGDDDSLTMQCKACHGTSLVLDVWEEAKELVS
jgi:hypothetical protein